MQRILFLLSLLFLITACQKNAVPTKQSATSAKGVVSAAHPLAAHAGRQMLSRGGNAADAAVAAGFALAVVEPSMSGLGGRLQAILRTKDGQVAGVDATTQTPIAYDTAVIKPQRYGYTTIGIPGVVAGLTKLLEDHGTLPLEVVIAPAIQYAEEGFQILPGEALRQSMAIDQIKDFPGSRKYFMTAEGKTYAAGDLVIQKDLANTLQMIAKDGRKAFYEGPIAEKIAADIQANGGCVALEDLKNYKAYSSKIVSGSYRGYDLHGLWLPSFGAITIEILQILENFPMAELSEAERSAAVFQAMRLAYEDRQTQYVNEDMPAMLTSKEHAAKLAKKITLDGFNPSVGMQIKQPESWTSAMGHTTHLTAADKDGMVVALTQSLGPNMGSKVATDGLGFLYAVSLGAYLRMYEPGQRVSSHISPFLVTQDGKPFMGLGAAGGSRIVTAVAQVLTRVIDQEMPLDQALAAPRVYPDQDTMLVETHPGVTWPSGTIATLRDRAFPMKSVPDPARFGRVHAVQYLKDKNKWVGAADPDWEGVAGTPKGKIKD